MNVNEKKKLRNILFRHLDGIAIIPTIHALSTVGIIDFIKKHQKFSFTDISSQFTTNNGYLNIALRLLASQGWLNRKIVIDGEEIDFSLTEKGKSMLQFSNDYSSCAKQLKDLMAFEKHLFNFDNTLDSTNLIKAFNNFSVSINNKIEEKSLKWEFQKHHEGFIMGPILTSIGMSNIIEQYLNNDNSLDIKIKSDFPLMKHVIKLFNSIKWMQGEIFTEIGMFFLKRASAYGVTVSYLPTFNNVLELLNGNPKILWKRSDNDLETHVDRRMNVWGSGGAHTLYFKKIDEIIIKIFNKPINEQPLGIADMGCGDGTLLKHLYGIIKNKTLRGKKLTQHPLHVIGADYNKAARIASNITLKDANIEHTIMTGDISDPKSYAELLKGKHGLDLKKMLNVRSFLDHNRIYSKPKKSFHSRQCDSSGAYAHRGRWIPNNELKQNLVEHFISWKKYIGQFGLLILELHTIDPTVTASNLGNTLATPYDATHGYSDQYIFEIETMLSAANEAGLIANPQHQARFPNNEFATISINLFTPQKS